jgi:hypothetical protein
MEGHTPEAVLRSMLEAVTSQGEHARLTGEANTVGVVLPVLGFFMQVVARFT